MKIESNIKLFNTEKDAKDFIDKNFEIEAHAYEFNLSDGGILWAIILPENPNQDHDDDADCFLDEDGDYVIRHEVIFKECK